MNTKELEEYWSKRYEENRTGWDIGYPSTPIQKYIDQISNQEIKILIPGAGNAYEAEYLYQNGFKNTFVLDISKAPLQALHKRVPTFPEENLMQGNFFSHEGQYDLIIEQTFFCSFEPSLENRTNYGKTINKLLNKNGKLMGLWFNHPLVENAARPFGGTKKEYLSYLEPYLECIVFEDCYNSIKPRAGKELFGIFQKK